jgi:general secretion pathway protein L
MLTQSFPKVRTVVDAPLQMEREVALLRQSGAALTAQDLEPLLAAFGTALPEGSAPGGLEFTTGQLTVKGVALGPEALALLTARLAGQGLSVRQDADRLVVRTAGAPRAAGQAPGAAAPAQGASR